MREGEREGVRVSVDQPTDFKLSPMNTKYTAQNPKLCHSEEYIHHIPAHNTHHRMR